MSCYVGINNSMYTFIPATYETTYSLQIRNIIAE